MSNVTPTRIIYSDEFKRYFLREHGKGRGVTEIFRNAGLPVPIIGRKRIERCAARWAGRTASTGPWSRRRRKRTACPWPKGSSRRRGIFWMACSSCYPGPNGSSTCSRRNGGRSGRIIVVTNEQAVHPIPNNPLKKEPKIPDVVEAMGVRSINLREFYDASGDLIPLPYPIQPTL